MHVSTQTVTNIKIIFNSIKHLLNKKPYKCIEHLGQTTLSEFLVGKLNALYTYALKWYCLQL